MQKIGYDLQKFLLHITMFQEFFEKCLNTEVFSGPNTGNYGPEQTLYLGAFHAVVLNRKKKFPEINISQIIPSL